MRPEGLGALIFVLPFPKYPFPLPNHSYISSRWWARYVTEQKAWLQNLAKSGSSPDKAKQLIFVVFSSLPVLYFGAGVILGGEIRGNLPPVINNSLEKLWGGWEERDGRSKARGSGCCVASGSLSTAPSIGEPSPGPALDQKKNTEIHRKAPKESELLGAVLGAIG